MMIPDGYTLDSSPPLTIPDGYTLDAPATNGNLIDGTPITADGSRSITDQINRQLQLAGRYGFEGITSPLNIPSAVANGVVNTYNWATDGHAQKVGYPATTIENGLNAIGMPNAENAGERLEGDAIHGVTGAKSLGSGSMANPTIVNTGAAIGGLSSGAAREAGQGPIVQGLAGLAGGLVGGPAAYTIGQSGQNLVKPFLQGGRDRILADFLASKARNPMLAASSIENAPEYVQGSIPASGVASGDMGLMGVQRGVENLPIAEQSFKDRANQQTSAQNDVLENVAGNPANISILKADREASTSQLYAKARTEKITRKALQSVLDELDKKIELAGPQNDAGKLLIDLKNKILAGTPSEKPIETGILDANGNPITRPSAPTLQQPIIGTYRETRDKLALKGMQPGALGAEVKSNVGPANNMLGQTLEQQSPSFQQAQLVYGQKSVPINQIEAGQAIKANIQSNSPNATGQVFPIVQPKLQQLIENGEINVDGMAKPFPLSGLTKEQQLGLKNLQSDMNRNAQALGTRVRPTSSTELKNLIPQTRLNTLVAHFPYLKGILAEKNVQLQEELSEAMLNNPKMVELLRMGRNPQSQKLVKMIINGMAGGGAGAISSYSDNQTQ